MITNYEKGVRLYFKIFAFIWVLIASFTAVASLTDVISDDFPENQKIASYIQSILLLVIHVVFYIKENNRFKLIKTSDFNVKAIDVFVGVLIGVGIGGTLPYIMHAGIYFEETTLFYETAKFSMTGLGDYFDKYSSIEIIIQGLISSILFPLFRTLLFIGIIYRLFLSDLSLTRASIQLTAFFTLTYLILQFNQIDIVSLFGLGIMMCYVYFRSKSIMMVCFISIFYDLPIYIYSMFSDFTTMPIKYLSPNYESIVYIVIWLSFGILGLMTLNKYYKVDYAD